MTESQLVNALLVQPIMQALNLTNSEKANAIKAWIPTAVNEVATVYPWDFTTDKATSTSIVDTSQYTLRGNSNNCQDIINVVYDDNMLEEVDPLVMDEFLTGRTISGVGFWTMEGRVSGGFPTIELFGTPSSAETMTYRYARNDVELGDIPSQYDYVMLSAVGKHMIPGFSGQYELDVKRMIRTYTHGGNSPMTVRRDPVLVDRNNDRSRLFGWS